MSLKQNLNLITDAFTDTFVQTASALGKTGTLANKGMTYLNNELDDLLADQASIGKHKTAYRKVLDAKAEAAVESQDEDAILVSAEKLIKGLEKFSNL